MKGMKMAGLIFITMCCASFIRAAPDTLDFDGITSNRDAMWHLSIGGGASIPLSGDYTLPVKILTVPGVPPSIFQYIFPELKGKLRNATVIEGQLTHRVTSFMDVGLLGGSETEHRLAFPSFLLGYDFPGFGVYPLPAAANFSLTVSKAVPIVNIGPWLRQGSLSYRPFVSAGVGWYYVDQQLWSANNTSLAWSRDDQYVGALAGAGVTFGLSDSGTVTLETRYEKIFNSGSPLSFFDPVLQLGYQF